MTKQVKVTQNFTSGSLSEAMQAKQVRLAFVTKVDAGHYDCIMPFVLCRDYLKDVLFVNFYCTQPKGLGRVFGMDMDHPKLWELDQNQTLLAVMASEGLINELKKRFKEINEIEEKLGCSLSTYEEAGEDKIVVTGDKRWMDSLLAISLYSFFFRWKTYSSGVPAGTSDARLVIGAENTIKVGSIDKINKFGFMKDIVKEYNKDYQGTDVSETFSYKIHNYYGIYFMQDLHSDWERRIPEYKTFGVF